MCLPEAGPQRPLQTAFDYVRNGDQEEDEAWRPMYPALKALRPRGTITATWPRAQPPFISYDDVMLQILDGIRSFREKQSRLGEEMYGFEEAFQ